MNNNNHFIATLNVNLCWPAPLPQLKTRGFWWRKFHCPHALKEGNWHKWRVKIIWKCERL